MRTFPPVADDDTFVWAKANEMQRAVGGRALEALPKSGTAGRRAPDAMTAVPNFWGMGASRGQNRPLHRLVDGSSRSRTPDRDLGRGVIRLERTKSGRRREIPLRQVVYDALMGLPGARTGRVWPVTSIRAPFERAVIEARLDTPLTFHDLLHHFASCFVMRGERLEGLRQILGHATLAMTMRYAHLAPDFVRGEMVRTERAIMPDAGGDATIGDAVASSMSLAMLDLSGP